MAFNLDFSGWKAAREAQRDSILNQAAISANLIADRADQTRALISGLGQVAGDVLTRERQPEVAPTANGFQEELMQEASSRNWLNDNGELVMTPEVLEYLRNKYNIGA